MTARDMQKELAAATTLKSHLRHILDGDLDAETLRDGIEGETNLLETVDAVIGQIGDDAARVEALTKFITSLDGRKARFEKRQELLRSLLVNALDVLGEKRLERPAATLTFKATAPRLIVTDESQVPTKFWKQPDPVLNKKELTDALKARGETDPPIPGAELSNGGATVQIRFS